MKKVILILFAIILLAATQGCKKHTDDPEPGPNPDPSEVIIADNTKVMDLETRAAISQIDTTNFTFTFTGETTLLSQLKTGDILVDSASEFARYGYLRKVTGIQSAKGQTTVTTAPAGLTEAILQGSIDFNSGRLRTDQIDRVELAEGVTLKTSRETDFTVFDMDYDMTFGSGNDKITVEGNTSLDIEIFFKFDWDYCVLCAPPEVEVTLFESGVELNQSASVNVASQYGANIENRIPVATFYFEPWTFTIGPVPVVFVPKVELFIEVDGSLTAEFSTGATEAFSGRLGSRYTSDDGWSMIKEKTFSFDYYPPQMDVSAHVDAGAGPEVSLMLYGVAGPYTNVTSCISLDAELHNGTNNWDMEYKVGVKAEAGIKIDVMLFEDEWGKSICLFEQTLMHLDNEPMETGIFFESPVDDSWLALGSQTTLKARVTGAAPSSVEFLVDGEVIGSLSNEPWELTWDTQPAGYGDHTLVVNDIIGGQVIASDTIHIRLLNAVWEIIDLSNLNQSEQTINHDVFFSGSDEGWMVGGSGYGIDGYMLHTTNGGRSWTNIAPDNFFVALMQIVFLNNNEILARAFDGKIYSSLTWAPLTYHINNEEIGYTYDNFDVNSFDITSDGNLIAVGNYYNSENYTIHVARAASGEFKPLLNNFTQIPYYYDDMPSAPYVYFRNNKGIVFNLKDQGNPLRQYIMLSDDGGFSWENMTLNASGITRDDDIYGAFFLNEQKGWLVGRESQGYAVVLRTEDGGASWEKFTAEEVYGFGSVWFLSTKEGYATVNAIDMGDEIHVKLYHTLDGGETWDPISLVHTIHPMKKVFFKGPYLGFTVGGGSDTYRFTVAK